MRQFVTEETLLGMMAFQRTSNIVATALVLAADLIVKSARALHEQFAKPGKE